MMGKYVFGNPLSVLTAWKSLFLTPRWIYLKMPLGMQTEIITNHIQADHIPFINLGSTTDANELSFEFWTLWTRLVLSATALFLQLPGICFPGMASRTAVGVGVTQQRFSGQAGMLTMWNVQSVFSPNSIIRIWYFSAQFSPQLQSWFTCSRALVLHNQGFSFP